MPRTWPQEAMRTAAWEGVELLLSDVCRLSGSRQMVQSWEAWFCEGWRGSRPRVRKASLLAKTGMVGCVCCCD